MWVLVHQSGTCTVFKAALAELNLGQVEGPILSNGIF